jgi:hypothetical protein
VAGGMSGAEQFPIEFDYPTSERDIERCVEIARALAWKHGKAGITMEDVREEAVKRGVLTGQEQGRRLSFLGVVPKRAKLVSTGQRRYTASKNPNVIWCLPEYLNQETG